MKKKNSKKLLNKIIFEKQLSKSTILTYDISIRYFEKETNITLQELIKIHEKERKQGKKWNETLLKEKLIQYRNFLYAKYAVRTAKQYFSKIIAILNHYEIEIGKLKPIKTKTKEFKLSGDLPTRKEIQDCINVFDNIIDRAFTLFLIATGLSPVDALKIKIKDYLKLTKDYHNYDIHHNILQAINEMKDNEIIIMIIGHREKSGEPYLTFATPESIKAINLSLLNSDKPLELDAPLFDVKHRTLQRHFAKANDKMGLGRTRKGERRFTMRCLRSYHDTQLKKAGLDIGEINILSGRKNKEVIYEHYIEIDEQELREKYIKALPYLTIEETSKIKTELENVREEREVLKQENKELKTNINNIYDRLNNLENRQMVWEQVKESQKK